MKKKNLETICIHGGWKPKKGESQQLPIFQSTTFRYETSDQMARLFDLKDNGYFYTRLANPTNDAVAQKIAALEGGVGAVLTSSGQAANFYAIFNICQAGDHFITANTIYGGTFNLFGVTLKKLGIECTFIDPDWDDERIEAAFRPNTKCFFGETISNPGCNVFDIERFAKMAHKHGVPLIVDNTFATPINCRPFEWGCDIVTHSTTKYMDGHATQVGGVVVDSGNFPWEDYAEKFPCLCTPDESYHGLTYTKSFGNMAYTTKLVAQLMRDLGSIPSPQNAFLLNLGLETLHLRMPRHCENAQKVAEWLVQKDRYKETIYTIEKSLLNQGENGIYIQSDDTLDTNCVHIGYSGKVRLELGKSKSKSKENVILVEQVIDYMNNLAGTNFKSTTKKTQSLINARLKEGVTLEELVSVVYYKYQTWVVKPFKFSNGVMSDTYFRPNTLFGTKFEEYLEDYKKQVKSNE